MEKSFSIKEAINFGWNVTKNNLGFFIKLLGLIVFIQLILRSISYFIYYNYIGNSLIFSDSLMFMNNKFILSYQLLPLLFILFMIGIIISIINTIGLIKISLKFCDNEKAKISDLFSYYPLFFKYLIGSILYSLIVILGLILLIIPGIIWAIQFQPFAYLIVDKGLGPIQALKESSKITKGNRWNLFSFLVILIFLQTLGAFIFLIGLFITVPITLIAYAYVYRKLLVQSELSDIPPELIKVPDELKKNI
jgi:hypothetical protein